MLEEKDCCGKRKKGKSFLQGLAYGLVPHIGCIAFIVGSVLGVTALMNFFKPILLNKYFFHILIGVSLGFATLSSVLYLRKNSSLSWKGARGKWKYLSMMYGSTIGVNLVLFMLIFPMLANVSLASPTEAGIKEGDLSSLTLKVNIPCPGHAPLISEELKILEGVMEIKFSFPNYFEVKYDAQKISKEKMLALEVFEVYSAAITEEKVQLSQPIKTGSCCGGTGRCGGGCGCGSY